MNGFALEKQLLEMICLQIQLAKPENVPKATSNSKDQVASSASVTKMYRAQTTYSAGAPPAASKPGISIFPRYKYGGAYRNCESWDERYREPGRWRGRGSRASEGQT
jgi:hypothetical protein